MQDVNQNPGKTWRCRRSGPPTAGNWLRILGLQSVLAILLAGFAPLHAASLDPEVEAKILLTALRLETKLSAGRSDLIVGVLYKPGKAASDACSVDIVNAMNTHAGNTKPSIRAARVPFDGATELERAVAEQGLFALYVCTGLSTTDFRAVSAVAAQSGAMSIGARKGIVLSGMTMGVLIESGRPKILLNETAADREGVQFSSRFYGLATKVKGK